MIRIVCPCTIRLAAGSERSSRAAQLAGDLAAGVLVDPLADQRRAMTAVAALELVRALLDPAAQQRQLELEPVMFLGSHGPKFAAGAGLCRSVPESPFTTRPDCRTGGRGIL